MSKWMLIVLAFLFVGCGTYQPAVYSVTDLNSGRIFMLESGKTFHKIVGDKLVIYFGDGRDPYFYGKATRQVVLTSWDMRVEREGRWVK